MISRWRLASAFPTRHAHCRFALLFSVTLALATSLPAREDPMPIGRWVDRRTGIELLIQRKNQARFSHPKKSSALLVDFVDERRVRHEYWLAIKTISRPAAATAKPAQSVKEQPAAPGASPWEVKAQDTATAGNPEAAGNPVTEQAPQPELQLPWLSADSKLIISYLMERPPPAPPKRTHTRKPAPKAEPAQDKASATSKARESKQSPVKAKPAVQKVKPPERPSGPRPILELLVFRQGALVFEGVFDPYQPPKHSAKSR